jgi:hypothetical protein
MLSYLEDATTPEKMEEKEKKGKNFEEIENMKSGVAYRTTTWRYREVRP